jgi:hypothetical protein
MQVHTIIHKERQQAPRKVQRDGEIMSVKEVVSEIYDIIQELSDIGIENVFIDLLDTANISHDSINKLCRGTNATPERKK